MLPNRIWLWLIALALCGTSCIKPYEPEISASDVNKLVVDAVLTDRDGNQVIRITRSSNTLKSEELPVTGCTVKVEDMNGHSFPFTDGGQGNYQGWIDTAYMKTGNAFKVDIVTAEGEHIVSDFDQYTECPQVDSVYYLRKDLPTANPFFFVKGIQFYLDLDARGINTHYFRIEAIETWEYHVEYPIEWYYDGKVRHVYPPDNSRRVCWSTYKLKDIFTLSTRGLNENKYMLFPLHYVNNKTSRLTYGYSLLVHQYSLSDTAYAYWNQLKVNSAESGGMYERQPMAPKGNLHNLSHPKEAVLGFFGVSSVHSKRIFIKEVEGLPNEYLSLCTPAPASPYGFRDFDPMDYPVYLMGDEHGYQMIILDDECVDCLKYGGTNVKPDFWPW